jgi:hypothetical protein
MIDLICENPPIERTTLHIRIMHTLVRFGLARPTMGSPGHGFEGKQMWEIDWNWLFRDDWYKRNEDILLSRLGAKSRSIFQDWVMQAKTSEKNIVSESALPFSIAPDALRIFEVVDGKTKQVVAIEFTNGPEIWFYEADRNKCATLRIGKVPHKSWDEDYERRLIYRLPSSSEPS